MKSFILVCRDAAKLCPDVLIREMLRRRADDLQEAIRVFNECHSLENMKELTAAFARAYTMLQKAYPTPEPIPPRSSSGELERVAA